MDMALNGHDIQAFGLKKEHFVIIQDGLETLGQFFAIFSFSSLNACIKRHMLMHLR